MREVTIFGKRFSIIKQKSSRDSVEVRDDKILVNECEKTAESLIKEFLADKLYHQLLQIYKEIEGERKVEVLGDLDFEIVESIDNKRQRIAKIKGGKILVKLNAVVLPKPILRYVIAHEIAHIFTKRHTERFWEIIKKICPNFQTDQKSLMEYEKILVKPIA